MFRNNFFVIIAIVVSVIVAFCDIFLGIQTHFHFNNLMLDLEFMQFDVILIVVISVGFGKLIDMLRYQSRKIARINSELTEKNAQLRELMLRKDRINAIIAHDLKSPFNGFLGVLGLLEKNYDTYSDEERKRMLKTLYKESEKMYTFLADLLQWSRLNSGDVHFDPETIRLDNIISSQVAFLAATAVRKKLTIVNEANPSVAVFGDRTLIETVVRNLVSNSIKFTPEHGRITLRTRQDGKMISLIVEDTGTGIDGSVYDAIQTRNLVSTKGTEGEVGSGFGLMICAEIMRTHYGRIDIESKKGEGTSIALWFPAAEA